MAHRFSLAQWLIEQGAEVAVICPSGAHQEALQEVGIHVYPMDWTRQGLTLLGTWRAAKFIRCAVKSFNPDIVHCVSIRCILLYWLAGNKGSPRKVINHVIGMGSVFSEQSKGCRAKGLKAIVTRTLKQAFKRGNAVNVFQNQDDINAWQCEMELPDLQWDLIPGSVPWEPSHVEEPSGQRFRILFVGRMLKDKGVRELCHAWRGIRTKDATVELVLCGDVDAGNPKSLSENELKELAEAEGIQWLGRRDDVAEQMTQANLVVLPSYREGLPRVLLEAGLANRAVVTTDVPGCREVVEHKVSGLLVPPEDVAALQSAIMMLKEDEVMRRNFAEALTHRVQQLFVDDVVNPRWWTLYQKEHP